MEDLKVGDLIILEKEYVCFTLGSKYTILGLQLNGMVILRDDLEDDRYLDKNVISRYFKKVDNQSERNKQQRPSGGSTHYYELPKNATELKDLIRYKKMSHPIGEIFCSIYRLHDNGEYKRNLQKAKFYIDSELEYLEKEEKEIRC